VVNPYFYRVPMGMYFVELDDRSSRFLTSKSRIAGDSEMFRRLAIRAARFGPEADFLSSVVGDTLRRTELTG
jgi:hypothetical protein